MAGVPVGSTVHQLSMPGPYQLGQLRTMYRRSVSITRSSVVPDAMREVQSCEPRGVSAARLTHAVTSLSHLIVVRGLGVPDTLLKLEGAGANVHVASAFVDDLDSDIGCVLELAVQSWERRGADNAQRGHKYRRKGNKTYSRRHCKRQSCSQHTDTLDAALPSRAHSQKLAQSSSIITRHHSCKSCTPGNHDTLPTSLFLILHAYLRYSSTMEDQLRAGMQQVRGGAAG